MVLFKPSVGDIHLTACAVIAIMNNDGSALLHKIAGDPLGSIVDRECSILSEHYDVVKKSVMYVVKNKSH